MNQMTIENAEEEISTADGGENDEQLEDDENDDESMNEDELNEVSGQHNLCFITIQTFRICNLQEEYLYEDDNTGDDLPMDDE